MCTTLIRADSTWSCTLDVRESIMQSLSSVTHSYTIQPTVSAAGKLLIPLFMVLKEPNRDFGPRIRESLFKAPNVLVTASKSGKLTSDHLKRYLTEVFFPIVGEKSVLLLDSWGGQCERTVLSVVPEDKELVHLVIPKGSTCQIQPLDVYGFRCWKNFVRRFSDLMLLYDYDVNLHLRNNIIKLQSLVHNQFSSSRFSNLLKYAWYKSGYLENRPPEFENPAEFCFILCCPSCAFCKEISFILCAWCKKTVLSISLQNYIIVMILCHKNK